MDFPFRNTSFIPHLTSPLKNVGRDRTASGTVVVAK